MNKRTEQAKEILATSGMVSQCGIGEFYVKSSTESDRKYTVRAGGDQALVCECDDHKKRGSDCKHIKAVLMFSCRNMGYRNEPFKIIDRTELGVCKYCDSGNIMKFGTRDGKESKAQIYKCRDCKKRFTVNYGFDRFRHSPEIITQALQLYYSKMSCRRISQHFKMVGINVSHMTIYKWVAKFSDIISKYLNDVVPRTVSRNMVRADEVYTKFSGHMHYIFASMDDDTRFWLAAEVAGSKYQHDADNLFEMTKKKIGRCPTHLTTDDLHAYKVSARRVFGLKTNHISGAALHSKRKNRLGETTNAKYHPSNNKMERLNGEFRDWEQTRRGLKKPDTPLIPGMVAYYNFAKQHSGLDGKTPADAALIMVEGKNKWKTLIQNAALHKIHAE